MRITRFIETRLMRRTSGGKVVREIEGLRFIAIAMVVLFHLAAYVQFSTPVPFSEPHTSDWLFKLLRHGDRGVPLFFMVSGFVLALPFALHHRRGAPPVSMKSYFLRRLTRLEPPYVAALLLFFALHVLLNRHEPGALFPHLLASIAYLHNMIYGTPTPVNSVAWSLEIEVQFYILAPLLARVFAIANPLTRRAVIVAGIVAMNAMTFLVGPTAPPRFSLSVLGHLHFFLVGFLMCDIFLHEWKASLPSTHWGWDLAVLGIAPALLWDSRPAAQLFIVTGFLMFLAAFRGPVTRRVLTNPVIVVIGSMCYSIYLLHYPIISFVGRFTTRLIRGGTFASNFALQALLVVPVVLLICATFYALIERPCMDRHWPRKLAAWLRGERSSAPTAPADPQPVP